MDKRIKTYFVIFIALLLAGFGQGILVANGITDPVWSGVSLPFVSAGVVLLALWVLKKYGKAEATL